jgi:hypothetical protein
MELKTIKRLIRFCLIAKKVPKINENNPTAIKINSISKKTLEIAIIHLLKKVKITNLGKIEKTTVVANGDPS